MNISGGGGGGGEYVPIWLDVHAHNKLWLVFSVCLCAEKKEMIHSIKNKIARIIFHPALGEDHSKILIAQEKELGQWD